MQVSPRETENEQERSFPHNQPATITPRPSSLVSAQLGYK